MKIRTILERSGIDRTPITVEYELEEQQPDGEWESRTVSVSGTVTTETDPYATGDSPTDSSFDPISVTDTETGEQIDVKLFYSKIDQASVDWIEDQAIQSAGY